MNLVAHNRPKLVLNTISTGTMVLMGRVTGQLDELGRCLK